MAHEVSNQEAMDDDLNENDDDFDNNILSPDVEAPLPAKRKRSDTPVKPKRGEVVNPLLTRNGAAYAVRNVQRSRAEFDLKRCTSDMDLGGP